MLKSKLLGTAGLALCLSSCTHGPKSESTGASFTGNPPVSGQETVVIMGLNDIHGALAPEAKHTKDALATPYERGGASILASHVRVLREEYGPRFLILDAGDEFQGSVESNLEQGAAMVGFFNAIGLSAAAVGNHEFDFGLDVLKKRVSEAKYPYIATNVVERKSGKIPGVPGTHPHVILKAGHLKIGVIGLTTVDTPTTTRQLHVKDLEFRDIRQATLAEAERLRMLGANLVVVTAHEGLFCEPGKKTKNPAPLRSRTDPQGECGDRDAIVKLLRTLPSGTVDAVVSGHTHSLVHHFVAGVPVIQSGTRNQYFNLIHLTWDWGLQKLVPELTRIEGPVPVCPKVFENQKDCNGDRPAPKNGRGSLVTPVFHGSRIKPDPAIVDLLQPLFKKTADEKKRVVGQAARTIEHTRNVESPFGNLAADAIRKVVGADVSILNSGCIRAPLDSGPIPYGSVFRALPFDNAVSLLTLTGKELKLLLRIAESGARGVFPVSGVRMRLIDPVFEAPADDLNGDKQTSLWEINRLIEAKLVDDSGNATDIVDSKTYRVATVDFLVTGGDDLGWFMSRIPEARVQLAAGPILRDCVAQYITDLSKMKAGVNSVEAPLVDPARPRFTFEQPPKRKSKTARRRRRGRSK